MSYAWIIDKDYLADDRYVQNGSDVGRRGPWNTPDSLAIRLAMGEGQRFEMRDDDGELYYSGRIVWSDDHEDYPFDGPEYGFEPLDDFGTPNAGCTSIRYPGSGPELGGGKDL